MVFSERRYGMLFFRPEGTTLTEPRRRQGEFHEPWRSPGLRTLSTRSPNGTALIPRVLFVQFQSMTPTEFWNSLERTFVDDQRRRVNIVPQDRCYVCIELVTKIVVLQPWSTVLRAEHQVNVDLRNDCGISDSPRLGPPRCGYR